MKTSVSTTREQLFAELESLELHSVKLGNAKEIAQARRNARYTRLADRRDKRTQTAYKAYLAVQKREGATFAKLAKLEEESLKNTLIANEAQQKALARRIAFLKDELTNAVKYGI